MAGKRMIHDNALRSRKLNSVSLGAGELWFRILLLVDDNGNYDGDRLTIYTNAMRHKKGVTARSVEGFVEELIDCGLLEEYTVPDDDGPYIHVANFHDFQYFKGDRPVKITFPVNPDATHFAKSGKPLLVEPDGSKTDTGRNPSGSKLVPDVNPEVEVSFKDKINTNTKAPGQQHPNDEPEEDLGNWQAFGDYFRKKAGGSKSFLRFESNQNAYRELCRKYGSDAVESVVTDWVEMKGGKKATKVNQYSCKNFLEDAADLIEDMDDEEEDRSDRLPLLTDPAKAIQ